MDRAGAADPFGRLVGTLVAAVFGAVFVLANTDAVASPWSELLRTVAAVVAAGVAIAAVRAFRTAARAGAGDGGPRPAGWGRGYWTIVAVEVVALVGGLVVVNGVLGLPRFAVAWVALVVGVHFLALGRVWRFTTFVVLGAVMSTLAVLGALVGALAGSAAGIQLLAGVGSGAALLVSGARAARERVPLTRGE